VVKDVTLFQLTKWTRDYDTKASIENLPLLLLELEEHEENPVIGSVPCYIPLSNRHVYTVTKDIQKSSGEYLLVDPPSCEDITSMAILETQLGNDSCFSGKSKFDIKTIIKQRFDIVGPKLRDIFVDDDRFAHAKAELAKDIPKLLNCLNDVSYHNIPDNAKNYMGVFLDAGVFIPSLTGRNERVNEEWNFINFLSPCICVLVAKHVETTTLQLLEREKFDYLVGKAIMVLGLMEPVNDYMDEKWKCSEWKFYNNPGANKLVSKKDRIHPLSIPFCTRKSRYNGMYLDVSASELEENTLYTSTVHNTALFDALLVSHSQLVVYVFQSSNLRTNKHSLNFSTIEKVCSGLLLDKQENLEYKIYYIYCGDSSKKSQYGFDIQNLPKGKTAAVKASNQLLLRFVPCIARVRYYPQIEDVEL
jgi:hypothetical protein